MIKSGDIWLIDFDPTEGREQSGRRPAIVVSGNAMNDHFGLSIVCPLTTSIKNMTGGVILNPNKTNNLHRKSEVLGMHIKSVSHQRFLQKIGHVDHSARQKILDNIHKILKY